MCLIAVFSRLDDVHGAELPRDLGRVSAEKRGAGATLLRRAWLRSCAFVIPVREARIWWGLIREAARR